MVLKKNDRQISFLHIYHHTTIFAIWWLVTYMAPGGEGNPKQKTQKTKKNTKNTQNTKHETRNTKHKTRNTKHKTKQNSILLSCSEFLHSRGDVFILLVLLSWHHFCQLH